MTANDSAYERELKEFHAGMDDLPKCRDLTMGAYKKDDRVIVTNPRHEQFEGLHGTVNRAIKDKNLFEVRLDDGRFLSTSPGSLTPETTRDMMLYALKRALFVLESPVLLPVTNGAGTVDIVRAAIKKAEAK